MFLFPTDFADNAEIFVLLSSVVFLLSSIKILFSLFNIMLPCSIFLFASFEIMSA